MANELLEAVVKAKLNYISRNVPGCINLFEQLTKEQAIFKKGITTMCKDLRVDFNRLEKRVKKLEQAKTFFPMTEGKHCALLNNCVDDDEAILHKREIKEGS